MTPECLEEEHVTKLKEQQLAGLARDNPPGGTMVWIPGGTFRMGSDHHYPEEAPAHGVTVSGFWIDRTPVTNRQFAEFVEETGYVTLAEIVPKAEDYPGALPHMLYAGSLVFRRPLERTRADHWQNWWSFLAGANWRRPYGADSTINDSLDHPVVHVACEDALAYARWVGKDLPTEAEWEFAAQGSDGDEFAWGKDLMPGGRSMANFWQGTFPWENLALDGYAGTSPVGTFPANKYKVYDMIGNVWEWTSDWFNPRHAADAGKPCCMPKNPRGGSEALSLDPCQPQSTIPRKVLKGGSHLCAPNYCRRYRPAARHPQPVDTSACHVGFRCVARLGARTRTLKLPQTEMHVA